MASVRPRGCMTGNQDTQTPLLTRGVRPQALTFLGFPHQQNRTGAPAGPFRENKISITRSRAKVGDTSWPVTGTAQHQRTVRVPQTFQAHSALAPRGGRRDRPVVLHDANASPPVTSSAHGAASPDPSRLSPQPPRPQKMMRGLWRGGGGAGQRRGLHEGGAAALRGRGCFLITPTSLCLLLIPTPAASPLPRDAAALAAVTGLPPSKESRRKRGRFSHSLQGPRGTARSPAHPTPPRRRQRVPEEKETPENAVGRLKAQRRAATGRLPRTRGFPRALLTRPAGEGGAGAGGQASRGSECGDAAAWRFSVLLFRAVSRFGPSPLTDLGRPHPVLAGSPKCSMHTPHLKEVCSLESHRRRDTLPTKAPQKPPAPRAPVGEPGAGSAPAALAQEERSPWTRHLVSAAPPPEEHLAQGEVKTPKNSQTVHWAVTTAALCRVLPSSAAAPPTDLTTWSLGALPPLRRQVGLSLSQTWAGAEAGAA